MGLTAPHAFLLALWLTSSLFPTLAISCRRLFYSHIYLPACLPACQSLAHASIQGGVNCQKLRNHWLLECLLPFSASLDRTRRPAQHLTDTTAVSPSQAV